MTIFDFELDVRKNGQCNDYLEITSGTRIYFKVGPFTSTSFLLMALNFIIQKQKNVSQQYTALVTFKCFQLKWKASEKKKHCVTLF